MRLFSKMHLKRSGSLRHIWVRNRLPSTAFPSSFTLRGSKNLPAVRNQGLGADRNGLAYCTQNVSVAALEFLMRAKRNLEEPLSAQHYIDAIDKRDPNFFRFVINHGVTLEREYKREGKFKEGMPLYFGREFVYFNRHDKRAMMYELKTNGPIIGMIRMMDDFDFRGLRGYKNNGEPLPLLDEEGRKLYDENGELVPSYHAVLIIGWVMICGKFYWRYMNCWGNKFGDQGFGRFAHKALIFCCAAIH